MRFKERTKTNTGISSDVKPIIDKEYMESIFELLCILDPDWSDHDLIKYNNVTSRGSATKVSESKYKLFKEPEPILLLESNLENILRFLIGKNPNFSPDEPNKYNTFVQKKELGDRWGEPIKLRILLDKYPCDVFQ